MLKRGVVPDEFFLAAVYVPPIPPFQRDCRGKCMLSLHLYMTFYCQQICMGVSLVDWELMQLKFESPFFSLSLL